MCGIAGVLRLTEAPIQKQQLISLLLGIEHRGTDATGIAMMTDGKLTVHKNDEIAWKYTASRGFNEFITNNLKPSTQSVILHTRAWTVGSPHKNENNHPMVAAKPVSAIVHNGGIYNHEALFKDMKLRREAETDSDIIRAIVDKEGLNKKVIRSLNRMGGSCAAAILHKDHPKKVMLLRSGSPLVLGHTGDHIMWASEKKAIHLAARGWKKKNGVWFMANRAELMFNPMAEESAWILDVDEMLAHDNDPDWEPWHDAFRSWGNYTAPNYRAHERYNERQLKKAEEKKKDESKEEPQQTTTEKSLAGNVKQPNPASTDAGADAVNLGVQCPNPKCALWLSIPPKLQNRPVEKLICTKCKTGLGQKFN